MSISVFTSGLDTPRGTGMKCLQLMIVEQTSPIVRRNKPHTDSLKLAVFPIVEQAASF